MESTEWLSVAEIDRRFKKIVADSAHLRTSLPPDSPYNAVLRVADIVRYIGVNSRDGRAFIKRYQRELSLFFKAWDHGNLVKARVGDTWKIVHRHTGDTTLAKVAAAPGKERPPIQCRIDMSVIGRGVPRLKVL